MTADTRIAALEAEIASLRKALAEFVNHPCHLDWGGHPCLEHSKVGGECLYVWANKETEVEG